MSTFTAYDRKVFFAAYVECALWSSTAMDETDTPLDSLVGMDDFGLGALGERLSEASKAYGEVDLYIGNDGKVYA